MSTTTTTTANAKPKPKPNAKPKPKPKPIPKLSGRVPPPKVEGQFEDAPEDDSDDSEYKDTNLYMDLSDVDLELAKQGLLGFRLGLGLATGGIGPPPIPSDESEEEAKMRRESEQAMLRKIEELLDSDSNLDSTDEDEEDDDDEDYEDQEDEEDEDEMGEEENEAGANGEEYEDESESDADADGSDSWEDLSDCGRPEETSDEEGEDRLTQLQSLRRTRAFIRYATYLEGWPGMYNVKELVRRLHKLDPERLFPNLSKVPDASLHLMVEFWNCRHSHTLIGVNVQYINRRWNLVNFTRGFKYLPFELISPTNGEQVETKKRIRRFLEHIGIQTYQIATIMTSNIPIVYSEEFEEFEIDELAPEGDDTELNVTKGRPIDTNPNPKCAHIDEGQSLFIPPGCHCVEDINHMERSRYMQIFKTLTRFDNQAITAVPTTFRTIIHGIIHECITTQHHALAFVRAIDDYFEFFNQQKAWATKLVIATGGTEGEKLFESWACPWKTFLLALDKITEESFRKKMNDLLKEATIAFRRYKSIKVPNEFTGAIHIIAQFILDIFNPLLELADELEYGSGVTSSFTIYGVTNAYRAIRNINMEKCPQLKKFKDKVMDRVLKTFTKNEIEWFNVYRNRHLILATILDPRFKMLPLRVPLVRSRTVFCDEQALGVHTRILEEEFNKMCARFGVERRWPDPPLVVTEEDLRKPGPVFWSAEAPYDKTEITEYLKLPIIPEHDDPLQYWKENEWKFPILSKVAKIYLALPTSCGTLERGLIISKNLVRARTGELHGRRSREAIEEILLYHDVRRSTVL